MDLASTRRAEHLPCGAEVADLIEQVTAGRGDQRTDHQATCPHCSALLPELDRLWAPIGEFTREQVTPPSGLVTAVMRQVRRLVAAAWLSLRTSSRGTTRVARWVVARIAGLAARQVPGVHQVLAHVADIDTASQPTPAGHSRQRRDAADVGAGRTAIHLALVTQYGESIPAIAQAVRHTVTKRIQDLTGLEVTEVNITIDDIASGPRRR
jgi:uncharacterized alkaline shock family protein YloU